MKKKLLFIIAIVLMILNIGITVQADMVKLTLPSNFKASTQNTETSQYNHIYLHATNDEQNEAIVLVQLENELTKSVVSLKQLNEESMNEFLVEYKKTKEQDKQVVLKQETYEKDDMFFIDTILEQKTNDKWVQTNEYYTIHEGKAIIISYSFLNKEVDTNKVRGVIDSVSITDEELVSQKEKNYTNTIILGIAILVLIVIYIIKQTKFKTQIDENEKQMLEHIIIEMEKETGGK